MYVANILERCSTYTYFPLSHCAAMHDILAKATGCHNAQVTVHADNICIYRECCHCGTSIFVFFSVQFKFKSIDFSTFTHLPVAFAIRSGFSYKGPEPARPEGHDQAYAIGNARVNCHLSHRASVKCVALVGSPPFHERHYDLAGLRDGLCEDRNDFF